MAVDVFNPNRASSRFCDNSVANVVQILDGASSFHQRHVRSNWLGSSKPSSGRVGSGLDAEGGGGIGKCSARATSEKCC